MRVYARKTALGLILLVFVFSIVAAGCSKKGNNDSSPSTSQSTEKPSQSPSASASEDAAPEPLTISLFNGGGGVVPTDTNKIYKKMKDELGVTLKEEYLVGDLEQKLGVMIAGGDYPDLITSNQKLTAAKAVIPLEDLIEQYAPNLKAHYAKVWNKLKDPGDGHIYWLPNYGVIQGTYNATFYNGPAFYIQKAVLKEFGYPKLKTLDDYFNLLEKYKAKYPQIDGQPTIGYTTLAFDWRVFELRNAPEHLAGYPNDGGVIVDPKTNVASLFEATDVAKPYFKKLNEENAKGMIDNEAFAQNYDQYLAKIASGRVLGMFDHQWNFSQSENTLISQQKFDRTYFGFPLVYDASIKDYYMERPPLNLGNGFGITVNAKDPVKIIKFLDTIMTEKWQKVFSWGIEGEDYQVGSDGKFFRTDEQRKKSDDVAWKQANRAYALYDALPHFQGTYADGNADSPGNQPDEYFATLKPIDKELFSAYGLKFRSDLFSQPPENRVSYPAWNIDLIEGSPAKIAEQKMKDLALKYLPKSILSKADQFESVWADYGKAMEKVDTKAYLDRINEQLKWRQDNWSN
ncbi:ABC transporter substrate-binding protein [Paenibacillus baekrokdamisoli]|uniref:ABC transporter substrate-binding protein n=1 Tax=Paenibacillus baekrokdamisoli TaxID=1712516 RepID=A0A3G9JEU6_9BACL|nr:ABC transporter substrate-binding protein [Paenibacillus baekrokdamisoli]MBB3068416.1 putative aldouronate transport system substrate-binding protein [Paenibacillus baekrokdamisoli]BBH22538.1 ABC transporter substrate-binding protein [Paenibacillus baekrokdamisoli]